MYKDCNTSFGDWKGNLSSIESVMMNNLQEMHTSDNSAVIRIERPVYSQERLNKVYGYQEPIRIKICERVLRMCARKCRFGPSAILKVVPGLAWLRAYQWRRDLAGDLVAGATVAVMHVPQGMAYALLGSVPPITGIYMAFFPVLLYAVFGTSRHISVGTFAVVCLMTGSVVASHTESGTGEKAYTPEQVASAVSFMVGCYHILMATLRLGIVSTLLSDPLVSGFSAGAAMHAFTSQLRDVFGVRLVRRRGLFNVPLTYYDLGMAIPNANIAAVVVSTVTILVLVVNNEAIKPWVSRRCPLPVPIELIVIATASLIASGTAIFDDYSLQTIGNIPTGFPPATLPPLELIPKVAVEALTIAVVAYTIVVSLALLFASKCGYEIDGNQELVALGFANIAGSLFGCMPVAASPSRSSLQFSVGGKTQLASFVSCGALVSVLLWLGPFFSPLPKCVLASIVLVALTSMLIMQVQDVVRFIRMSLSDGILWVVTFMTAVFVDLDFGLAVGVAFILVTLLVQSLDIKSSILQPLQGIDIYVDTGRYSSTEAIRGIKILQFCGMLNFATQGQLKTCLQKLVPPAGSKGDPGQDQAHNIVHTVILDLSRVCKIDPAGVSALLGVQKEMVARGLNLLLAGAGTRVFQSLQTCCGILDSTGFALFPTIHDAVVFAKSTFGR